MKINYGKQLNINEIEYVKKISTACGIEYDTARLLFYRGINTVEKAKNFLNPGKKHFNNPFDLNDMDQAVERLMHAKERGENVLIFGDYDADGVCATTILYKCLKDFGIEAFLFVPERELGYGLNVDVVSDFINNKGVSLVVTVDCGISDCDKIEIIKQYGAEVIVTDHHEPPEVLPNCIKINPKIRGQEYPFTELCGAGVAYKLGYALIGEKANDYLDYVAVATIADSMELVDENRDLVFEGLKIFNSLKLRLQFSYLIGENDRKITSQSIAYTIAPRINAGGRMGDVNSVLKFFISTDPNEIYDLAIKLNQYNIARQMECDRIFIEAKEKIYKEGLDKDSVILVQDDNWGSGFIGIVAAKLVELYNRPVIVFTLQDGHFKGSARSVDNINIYNGILQAKELLIGFGGHSQAAGVSVEKVNFLALKNVLCDYASNLEQKAASKPMINVEWEIDSSFSDKFAKEINLLGPFGMGNRVPLFSSSMHKVKSLPLKKGSQHILFSTPYLNFLMFNGESSAELLSLPIDKKVVFELSVSTFHGKDSVKGIVKNIIPDFGDFSSLKYHVFRNEILKLRKHSNFIFFDKVEIENQLKIEYVNANEVVFNEGNGTLYVLSNVENIKEYTIPKDFPIGLFSSPCANSQNCLIVSPNYIPVGYTKIVYLDTPLSIFNFTGENMVVSNFNSISNVSKIQMDRKTWEQAFIEISSICGSNFVGTVETVLSKNVSINYETFICAIEVFFELGFIKIENGELVRDYMIKNALTNSGIYSKIYSLKGDLC